MTNGQTTWGSGNCHFCHRAVLHTKADHERAIQVAAEEEDKDASKPSMSWEDVCHFIAQAAVNIFSGETTIEPGSKIHQAMEAFCVYVPKLKYVSSNFARDLDNLRGDAESAGQEVNLRLAALKLDDANSVMLDYDVSSHVRQTSRGPVCADDLEVISRSLRAMGWKTEITDCGDGVDRVCVEVTG